MKSADEIEELSGSEKWTSGVGGAVILGPSPGRKSMSLQSRVSVPSPFIGLPGSPLWDGPIHFIRADYLTLHCTTLPSSGRGRMPLKGVARGALSVSYIFSFKDSVLATVRTSSEH